MIIMSCKRFSTTECHLFPSKWFVSETMIKHCFEILPSDVFFTLQVSFQQIYYAIAKQPDKLISTTLKEMTLPHVEKKLERLKSGENLCFYRPKTSNASSVQARIF